MKQLSPEFHKFEPSKNDGDSVDLGALLGAIWRGKWLIAAITFTALAAVTFYTFVVATPLYSSTAAVILDSREEQVVDIESVVSGLSADASAINTEVEVLRSRGLMTKVVDKLGLTEDPEFNPAQRPPGLLARIKGTVLPAKDAGVPLGEVDSTVDQLIKATIVRNVPLSLVFTISVTTSDPEKSALIADKIADTYILDQLDVKFEATKQATDWLSGRVAELKSNFEASEAAAKAFSAGTNLVDAETLASLERRLKETRSYLAAAESVEVAAEERLERLRGAADRAARAQAAADPELTALAQSLGTEPDPADAEAFDRRFGDILARAELEAGTAAGNTEALLMSRDQLKAEIDRQSGDLIALEQLTREAESDRSLYEYFLGRMKETSVQQGIQQSDSRVLSRAVLSASPSSPKKPLLVAMAGTLGIMLGTGLVLLREARTDTYRNPREIERDTGHAVMGQIPLIPGRTRKARLAHLIDNPASATAEAVRNLRTSLLLSATEKTPQVVVVTSSVPDEGKTSAAFALAHSLSSMGKVLLVEGDIRKRVFSQYLDKAPTRGLLSVLSGEVAVEHAAMRNEHIGVDVLIGENSMVSATDVFSSPGFASFVREVRKHYDSIVIDTPSVLVVPDARVIAQFADAVLFTVKWDSTSKTEVAEGLRMFESVNQTATGIVLNQISPAGMQSYGHGKRYGAYAEYGKAYYPV